MFLLTEKHFVQFGVNRCLNKSEYISLALLFIQKPSSLTTVEPLTSGPARSETCF